MKLFKTIQTSFENFDETIKDYLTKSLNNLNIQYSDSQIFSIIFRGVKGVLQNMMFYIEDAFTEQNIFTASRKQSVYSLAKLSGYEPYYGSSASGIILGKLKINNGLKSKTTKIIINNNTKIKNKSTNVVYSIVLPADKYVVDISKPLIVHEFKVIQGFHAYASYISKGNALETIHVTSIELFDIDSIEVKVDGVTYSRAGNLYDMSENGLEYMVNIGYDNSFDIIFGNGIYGKKLRESQTISITYIKHGGQLGNINPNEKSEFKFIDAGYDIYGNGIDMNEYIDLEVSTYMTGGLNSDSIGFIRSVVGTNSRSNVLVSTDNFKLFLKRFSFIGYSNIFIENNTLNIVCVCLRNFTNKIKEVDDYYNLTNDDLLLYQNEKDMVVNTLQNSKKMFAGLKFTFEDPIIRKYAFICYVKTNNVYNQDLIKLHIKKILATYFMGKISDCQFISKSDIIKTIHDEIPEIDSINIEIISALNEECFYQQYYDKYIIDTTNNNITYRKERKIYDGSFQPGLDSFGNILLDSKLEIPIIHGGFDYYFDKNNSNRDDSNKRIKIAEPVQVYFI